MFQAKVIYADAPPEGTGKVPAGWHVYKGSDQGGTLWVVGLEEHREVVEKFIQFWADHMPMVRNLCLAWVKDLTHHVQAHQESQSPPFSISFNEHVVILEDENDPTYHLPTIGGWHVYNGHQLLFVGLEAYRPILEKTVARLIKALTPHAVVAAWAKDFVVENWYPDPEDEE